MVIRFDGQVAIVTGSGRGLGALSPQELRPEQVAPGVAFLASSRCNFSGVVLRASKGHFSVAQWQRSAGIDFGETIATPEEIADQWSSISGA